MTSAKNEEFSMLDLYEAMVKSQTINRNHTIDCQLYFLVITIVRIAIISDSK